MAPTGIVVAMDGVPYLPEPPKLTLLHHEQTDDSLHQTIRAIPLTLLNSPSTLVSGSSQLPVIAPSPAAEVTLSMASSASSIQSVSVAPTPPVELPTVQPTHDIDVFVKHGQDGRINSGTVSGLIQELVVNSRDAKARDYKVTFLAVYPAFTTADQLLQRLLERFQAASSSPTMNQDTDVRFSVILFLEFWVQEGHITPTDVQLLRRIREFAASVKALSTDSVISRRAQTLVGFIDRTWGLFDSAMPPLTTSISNSSLADSSPPEDFTPRDLADVLTSLEGDRYRNLSELDYVYWLEGTQVSNAVSTFIVENKKLSYWAERSILRSHRQSQRAENLKYFLLTIKECRRLHNFSSACALSAGVTTAAITSLKRTYGDLDRKSESLFRDAQKIILDRRREGLFGDPNQKVGKSFRAYRTVIKEAKNACIPWLYVHLQDLKKIHRASPEFVDEDGRTKLINFERCRHIHGRIRQIRAYEPPVTKPTNPVHHARLRVLVEAELNAIIIDQEHCIWAQKRGDKLAAEERKSYDTYEEELRKAGFLPSRPSPGFIQPTRKSSTQDSRQRSSTLTPLTPHSETIPSLPQPPGPSDRKYVHTNPCPLDVFNRHSQDCLDGRIQRPASHPTAGGGYADIWEGLLGDQKVAIKCLRYFSSNGGRIEEPRLLRRLWREYAAWTWVSHPIVLKCLGFTYDFSPEGYSLPSLISPWMSNGTLTMYLANHPKTDRLQILRDVAEGLAYLHEQNPAIIHGDIRGGNILISDSGRPCLSDFGLSKVLKLEGMTATSEPGGSLRWMSPELFKGDAVHSAKSDVWAYAMTVLEIMSGRHPYAEVGHEAAAVTMINQGQLPLRSPDFTDAKKIPDDVWAICQKCWNFLPKQRPSMQEVFSELASLTDDKP